MYLSNIISTQHNDFEDFVNVVDDIEKIDKNLPTLIVGREMMRKLFPGHNILDKKIDDNLYWTYARRENRYDYEKDILEFYKITIQYIESKIRYYYFDIKTRPFKQIKKMVTFMNAPILKTIYHSEDMLFISFDENVIGISLKDFRYLGITEEKVIEKVSKNNYNYIYKYDCLRNYALRYYVKNARILNPYIFRIIRQK